MPVNWNCFRTEILDKNKGVFFSLKSPNCCIQWQIPCHAVITDSDILFGKKKCVPAFMISNEIIEAPGSGMNAAFDFDRGDFTQIGNDKLNMHFLSR